MEQNEIYLYLAVMLFTIGCVGFIFRRNIFIALMSIELMLNGINLAFVAAGNINNDILGQATSLFFIIIAVAESAVGLALIVSMYRAYKNIESDVVSEMKH